jgi:hypothetical protein
MLNKKLQHLHIVLQWRLELKSCCYMVKENVQEVPPSIK